ncbi:MAG: response regulator with CheY-like receiver, AAA-type ATPase, and DNA-binding domain [Proteobacteria bacterium]|nr:response regulator with CheY-like receiver, AAA-type ATPase, and DNA-binding domain [Pseudomonadota bacterium]
MDTKAQRRILVVDDEPNIVSVVKRELSAPPQGRYRYEVEGFTEPLLALERAKTQSFDLVISDYRMPVMDGLTFLKAFLELQPDCATIVLSGWTDMDALIEMVNRTHIFRFIPKPWHDYFLKGSIAQALDYNGVMLETKRLAAQVLERKIEIPPLAGGIDQIIIVDSNEAVLEQLAQQISSFNKMDKLYSSIRQEILEQTPYALNEDKINVHTTTSPAYALNVADDLTFSCLLTAYKLPQMNGIDLLRGFADKQPDCAGFLIGEISMDNLISAVDVHIFGVFHDPLKETLYLKSSLAQALMRRRMMIENRVLAEMLRSAQ